MFCILLFPGRRPRRLGRALRLLTSCYEGQPSHDRTYVPSVFQTSSRRLRRLLLQIWEPPGNTPEILGFTPESVMNWSPKAGIPDTRIPDSLSEQSQ
eukprot:490584-Prorocentrum_minimum.AAC.1